MDLYLPALPALTAELGAATSLAQLTVTACLIGLAAGQLIAGPLSDRFGRRGPVLIGVDGVRHRLGALRREPDRRDPDRRPSRPGHRRRRGHRHRAGRRSGRVRGRTADPVLRTTDRDRRVRCDRRPTARRRTDDGAGLAWAVPGPVRDRRRHPRLGGIRVAGDAGPRSADERRVSPSSAGTCGCCSPTAASSARLSRRASSTRRCSPTSAARPMCCRASTACRRRATPSPSGSTPPGSWRSATSPDARASSGASWGRSSSGLAVAGLGAAGLLVAGLTHVPLGVVIVSLFLLAAGTAITSPPSTTLALADYPQIAGTASSLLGAARFAFGGIAAPLVGVAGVAQHPARSALVTTISILLAAASGLVFLARPARAHAPAGPTTIPSPRKEHPHAWSIMHAPGDVRVEERDDPTIQEPTDAIIRVSAACICGSDLWPYRGTDAVTEPTPMGHEYVGVVEQIGDDVTNVKVGDFVVGSFFASDNTCEICQSGYQSRCVHAVPMGALGTQAELLRVPLADGTLVATPDRADPEAGPRAARRLRRARHGMVRRGGRRGRAGQDGRRRRRRRGRAARRPRGEAARRGPHHRDESPRRPPGARPPVRSDRHRRGARRGRASRRSRSSPADSARTR